MVKVDKYLKIFIDGGSRGNPGPSAIGAVIYDQDGNKLDELSKYIGESTNNIAEYKALDEVLDLIKKYDAKNLIILSDSNLLNNQLKKNWKIKDKNILKYYESINSKLKDYIHVDLRLIPREENKEADALVNKALDRDSKYFDGEEDINFSTIDE